MIIRCIGRTALNVSAVCVLMAAAAFGGACTSDLALPAEAQIACGAATDCPTGWTCNANLGRCVRSDVLDSSAPALVGEAAITPPILKRGATATLKFETSEALADFPVVTVKIRGQDRTLTADEKASRGREFIFKYTAVGDEPQDTDCQINIVLTDQSGNRSGNISGRNLRFDFAVPSIDKVSIEGSPAKKGAKVLVRFSVSEPLAAAPAVNLTLALDPSSTGLDYVYSYTATGDESEGAPGAGVTVDIRDEAGNAATGLDAGAAVFDFSTPALKQAPVITPAVVRAGMTATVTFETNEEMKDGFPIVKVGETELAGRAVPGNSYEYGYKVSGLEADGERALRIDLSDLAGNDATNLGGGRFTVDSTPPVISGLVSEKPRYSAVPGHEVATVTFDSTEDVGAGLNVTIGGTAMTCGAWRGASPSYTCTHTVGAAEGEGTKEISVQAVDAAGNTGFESRTVEYDFTGPALSLSVQPNGRPARLGEMVTVGVAAGEALSANGVQIDGGGLELGTPSGSGTSFTWTYTVKATDSGTFNLSATAADAVGNPSAAAATGTVTLDGILPVVSNAALKPARVAKGGTFTLTFDVSEAPAEDPAVAFSNGVDAAVPMAKTSNAGLSYTYTGTAPVSGSAPFYSVTVSLRDAAGNGTVAGAGTVEIDNVAPGFSGIEVAPKAARLSSTIQAVLTATEPLSGPPALTAKNGPDTIAFSPADPTPGKISYSYTYSVTGATAQGTYAIQPFDLTDEATNTRAGVTPNPPVTFSVDSLPASLASASITPNAARHGDVINIEFTASEDLGVPPVVRVGALRIDTCTADPADGRHWTCTHTADTAEGDGVKQVYVELTDLAGNPSTLSPGTVTYDVTAPQIVGASILRTPAYTPAIDDATGTTYFSIKDPLNDQYVKATLVLYADEDIGGTPSLNVTGPSALAFTLVGVSGKTARFEYTLKDTDPEGTYTFSISWADALGNQDTRAVAGARMVIDKTPPDNAQIDFAKVVYKRVPWGSDATGGVARFSLAGAAGAVKDVTDIENVLVYRNATPSAGTLIGSAPVTKTAPDTGSFSIAELTGGDLPNLYLSATDRAGARSAPQQVKEIEWTATMGYKVPGSTFENPNIFTTTSIFWPTLEQAVYPIKKELNDNDTSKVQRVDPQHLVRMAEQDWTLRTPTGTKPNGREDHMMVYDNARGRMVMFGGYVGNGGYLQDIWEWQGTTAQWTDRTNVGTKPSARNRGAAVYDSARGKVVVFGGHDGVITTQDIWEWDGTTGQWTERTSIGEKPSPRYRHAMAYDSARGKVVMFGGADGMTSKQDIWEWDGATGQWAERTPVGAKPSARASHAMTYDIVREKVVMFGGWDLSQDIWEWDGATGTWTERTPVDLKPSGRESHAMSYNFARGKVVLFGGFADSGIQQDLWEWDGVNGQWTERTPVGAKPSARLSHAMAYDNTSEKVIVFGGNDSNYYQQDIWEWDGATGQWMERTPASTMPDARQNQAMAYDSARGKVVMFGGDVAGGIFKQDTWEWDGSTGQWVEQTPVGAKPNARGKFAMVYNSTCRKTILFGGTDDKGSGLQDTWEWNGALGTWTDRTPASTKPSGRYSHAMTYDSAREKVVLFGGAYGPTLKQDIWDWDCSTGEWTDRTLAGVKPSARAGHALAYNGTGEKVVMFGGNDVEYKQDVWEWDGVAGTWTDRTPSGLGPSARSGHALVYDDSRGKVVLFGGVDYQIWEWDGTTGQWADRTTGATKPSARRQFSMAYDSRRSNVVMFGGSQGPADHRQDIWEWNGHADGYPGMVMEVPFRFSGADLDVALTGISADFSSGGSAYAGVGQDGVKCFIWDSDPGGWRLIAMGASPASAPANISWQATGSSRLQTLLFGDQQMLIFAVTPAFPNGTGVQLAATSIDYAEVVVKYRLP